MGLFSFGRGYGLSNPVRPIAKQLARQRRRRKSIPPSPPVTKKAPFRGFFCYWKICGVRTYGFDKTRQRFGRSNEVRAPEGRDAGCISSTAPRRGEYRLKAIRINPTLSAKIFPNVLIRCHFLNSIRLGSQMDPQTGEIVERQCPLYPRKRPLGYY